MTTHLLVAPGRGAFGELLLGLRLAEELHARGDRVHVLAPAAYALLLAGTPFPHGHIDRITGALDRALPEIIQQRGCDQVILCDLLATLLVCGAHRIDPGFLDRLPVATAALDIWDLRSAELDFDMGEVRLRLPDAARTLIPRRLVPVPFARRTVAGGYCALPVAPPLAPAEVAAARAALGLAADARLVVTTTATYQTTGFTPAQARAAAIVPGRVVAQLLAIDPRVHVLHIGPRALAEADPRYQHRGPLAPAAFRQLLGAADLYVTPNQAATSLSSALVLGVPALAVIGASADPLGMRFRAFPIGLHDFIAPIVADNDYVDAVPAVDLFGGALADRAGALLFDSTVRAAALARARQYCEDVRALPRGTDVLGR
jgi:hypothetical protein